MALRLTEDGASVANIKYDLQPGERVVLAARVSAFVLAPAVIAFAVAVLCLGWEMVAFRSPAGLTGEAATLLLQISAVCFLLAIVLGVQAFALMFTTELAVTRQRVIARQGWLPRRALGITLPRIEGISVQTLDLLFTRIESVGIRQGYLGQILDLGTVTITGTGHRGQRFQAIEAPVALKMKIDHMIDVITEAAA